jgi:TolA-binding protein
MDVHPPHGPIRSWKDFTLHLLTITIGLLIALALEAAVQSLHHRHMVSEARVNLRREIVENQKLYTQNLHSLQAKMVELQQDIDQLRELRAGRTP